MIDGLSNFVLFTVQVQKRDFRNKHKRVQKHRQQFVGTQFTQAERDCKRCSRCKVTKFPPTAKQIAKDSSKIVDENGEQTAIGSATADEIASVITQFLVRRHVLEEHIQKRLRPSPKKEVKNSQGHRHSQLIQVSQVCEIIDM